MTVIYANNGDRDTLILQHIWEGLNCWVIEIGVDTVDFEDEDDLSRRMPEFMLKTPGGVKKTKLISKN